MKESRPRSDADLAAKIARLVEERGWNQEEFARIARLNRHTVRGILLAGRRTLRNATVSACARALGVTVHDLHALPLADLLPQMHAGAARRDSDSLRRLKASVLHPDMRTWIDDHPDRVALLSDHDVDDALAFQEAVSPSSPLNASEFFDRLDRKRRLLERVHLVAGSAYFDLLDQLVSLLYDKVVADQADSQR
jgi:transcriptional regulator with XRE-family HTH domain